MQSDCVFTTSPTPSPTHPLSVPYTSPTSPTNVPRFQTFWQAVVMEVSAPALLAYDDRCRLTKCLCWAEKACDHPGRKPDIGRLSGAESKAQPHGRPCPRSRVAPAGPVDRGGVPGNEACVGPSLRAVQPSGHRAFIIACGCAEKTKACMLHTQPAILNHGLAHVTEIGNASPSSLGPSRAKKNVPSMLMTSDPRTPSLAKLAASRAEVGDRFTGAKKSFHSCSR